MGDMMNTITTGREQWGTRQTASKPVGNNGGHDE